MAVFITSQQSSNGVRTFTRDPKVAKAPIGYVINAHCDDATIFAGRYVAPVGFADDLGPGKGGKKGWKLRRDAVAAMQEAISLGILQELAA